MLRIRNAFRWASVASLFLALSTVTPALAAGSILRTLESHDSGGTFCINGVNQRRLGAGLLAKSYAELNNVDPGFIADRVLTGDLNIPRESAIVLLDEIMASGRLKYDPSRNDFPVTLHDPCNMVRLMGIVSPQREIMKAIVPEERFREMAPHGVDNYCCGGGSGFAIMSGHNFSDWKMHVPGRRKFRQILEAFQDEDLEDLKTVRDAVDYVHERVGS